MNRIVQQNTPTPELLALRPGRPVQNWDYAAKGWRDAVVVGWASELVVLVGRKGRTVAKFPERIKPESGSDRRGLLLYVEIDGNISGHRPVPGEFRLAEQGSLFSAGGAA